LRGQAPGGENKEPFRKKLGECHCCRFMRNGLEGCARGRKRGVQVPEEGEVRRRRT